MKTFDINNIQLTIQSPHVILDEEFNDYIISKIEKLGKTYGRITRCEMLLKVNKNNMNENCEVEAKLFVPGHILFAVDKKENFRLASKVIFDDLQKQLSKFKDKIAPKNIST